MTLIAALFATDPQGLGGVALRSSASEQRNAWLAQLKSLLPAGAPQRRIPLHINDTALLGGLDLGATLHAGRPVAQQGVLACADGGVVFLAMAERVSVATAARLTAVLDTQRVVIERDGLAITRPARLGVVALDEGMDDDEQVPAALLDRLAFLHRLNDAPPEDFDPVFKPEDVVQARALLPRVQASAQVVEALCAAALALGVYSMRAPLFALKAARCAAALDGALEVTQDHAALAARLVLAPRATQLPSASPGAEEEEPQDTADSLENQNSPDLPDSPAIPDSSTPPEQPLSDSDQPADISAAESLNESIMQAAQAAIPSGLLAALEVGQAEKARTQAAGRSGAAQKSQTRGRPLGARRGEPRAGSRLNVMETLRAAAPWQKLREKQSMMPASTARRRIYVRREDFHVTRFRQFGQTTTLFVVDASGSSALHRLAEAKGAVELLLADCYVRRDRVAVLAFRGKNAELLLPPTRSLARAKRALAGLPGGGGTPLAAALDAARELADQISRRGETPIVVLLTDGRGNIARDGTPGRVQATVDATTAARQLKMAGFTALLLDTSPQPQPAAQELAAHMGAAYVALPHAGAQAVSRVVQIASVAARS